MLPAQKVAFHTLGCKLNFTETSAIARLFTENGFAKVDFDEEADIYVINTCSVTDFADKKCRQLVSKIKNRHPSAKIIMTGCYAQLKPKELASIPGVTLVLGANEKFKILDYLQQSSGENYFRQHIKLAKEFYPAYSLGDRTRVFFKVQDGCDYFCSFCTIPLARGRSRSATIQDTISIMQQLEKEEVKELVLTGVNIGDFGKQHGETFFELLQAIAKHISIPRIRISSIEPNLLTDEMIDFLSVNPQFVPHFHIPLQSGSDKLLQLMRRKYDTDFYAGKIAYLKSKMPDVCIGVDVITGFPGETDKDFERTFEFLKNLDVAYLHVFTYSERNNTTAVRMEGKVPMHIRKERSKILQQLSSQLKSTYYRRFTGKVRPVLFEQENHEGEIHGYSDNYIKIALPYDKDLCNKIIPVKITDFDSTSFVSKGEIAKYPLSLKNHV